ncbi:MAG TPA: hypothetical protein VMU14_18410, partial [Acidimicrobiales bacterium]|nr:hypothetical protein [Acidimicrobiales bacterium]
QRSRETLVLNPPFGKTAILDGKTVLRRNPNYFAVGCQRSAVLTLALAAFGALGAAPALGRARLPAPAVALAADPSGVGYWVAGADGSVAAFGSAHSFGSLTQPHDPIVALVPTPSGAGYWLVAADGGVFTFGDAQFAGAHLAPGTTTAAGAVAPLACAC